MILALLPLMVQLVAADPAATVAVTLPTAGARKINPSFISHGFEQASFVPFVLDNDNNTNTFSVNLFEGITNRTGGETIIRLGGTSADYATYVADQEEPCLPVASVAYDDDVGGTTIGPSYWQLTKRFPNAKYMIQVPLANADEQETINWVQSACDNMDADQIYVFEIGNEPDWYSNTYTGTDGVSLVPPEWQGTLTDKTYVGNWTSRANAVAAAVTNLPAQPIFQAYDTAAHCGAANSLLATEFAYNVTFPMGMNKAGYIKAAGQHYYQNQASGKTVKDDLMVLTDTHDRLDNLAIRVDYLEENHPDIEFVISESANSLGARPEYQTVLGSALWQVDFYLYTMALGVQRVHWQQMVNNAFLPRLWLPVYSEDEEPQVYSNYYATMLVADFMGNSGSANMSKIDLTDRPNFSAYAAFEDDVVKRVAVVNMNYWDESIGGTRVTTQVQISVPSGTTSVEVRHLNSPDGATADASTITYGGSQWTYESLGYEATGVRNDTETIAVVDGVASFDMETSSAALVTLL